MLDCDPRIRTALKSINPTSENPAHHGAPSALGVLRGVKPAAAVWRPYAGCNNIREIALHIAIHENGLANRLSGKNVLVGLAQWKFGWVTRCDVIDEVQWESELRLIKMIHERLVEAVRGFDPCLLDQPVGKKTLIHAVDFIHGIAEHSLYHTAQMEMLKTLAQQASGES
jgi:hypothetical protein